jgi:hypothetical protein
VNSRASQLFQKLQSASAETVIDELILDRQSEELWLDFKRVATKPADTKLHANDRKNLARAISGFGNSVGGIILWGIECADRSDKGDVASAEGLSSEELAGRRNVSVFDTTARWSRTPGHRNR